MKIAFAGLGVMGANLARNLARHGHAVAVHNRTEARTVRLMERYASEGDFVPATELADFVASLRTPRVAIIMVQAGAATEAVIDQLRELLEPGDIIVDGITGDLSANAVSGDVQIRGLTGTLNANSVSGEVAATGSIRKATIDTVSGNMLVDSTGRVDAVSLNTVSGDATVRIDEGHPANFVLRSVSGRLTVDGIKRSTSGPSNYVDSVGELSGSFVDVRANSVSGDVTVLRRAATQEPDAAASAPVSPSPEPEPAEPIAQQERHPGALVQTGGLAGVEVDDEPVRVERLAVGDPPLRHVQLDAVEVDEIGQLREVLDEGIGDVVDLHPRQPVGCAGGQVLFEEAHVVDPVGEAHAGHRPSGEVGEDRLTGPGVVREHLSLRRLRRGVEHLVERGEPQGPAGHLDARDGAAGVSHRPSPAGRWR